ncbi:hypothetical protein EEL32_12270 [Brevibacillus laterosporus]|nr:hypothetical protein EEL32_12270 [Brevibacillus laterosporus]
MKPGDVIYGGKKLSTFFVGHVGIVGRDFQVYHAHPSGGLSDGINYYVNRFNDGDILTILRPDSGGKAAAKWAENNIDRMTSYSWNVSLGNVSKNYCSKFIWQAFYFGWDEDILDAGKTDTSNYYVTPIEIYYSNHFTKIGEIEV